MNKKYPDEATYNKLVRDRIPEIIEADGLKVEIKEITQNKIIELLKQKSVEESKELVEAVELDDIKKEIADVSEVLKSLKERLGISEDEIEQIRQDRAQKRGRFKKGIFLVKTYKEDK